MSAVLSGAALFRSYARFGSTRPSSWRDVSRNLARHTRRHCFSHADHYSPPEGSLKARRLAANLSQTELAIAAGCSLSTVQFFDRGYVPPRSEAFARVNAALDEALAEAKA